MDSLPRVSVVSGPRNWVPVAPLATHLAHLATSETTALVYTDETSVTRVSYSELETRTNILSRAISSRARASGTNRDGDYIIAVCMQPTHNTIMTLLATWKAGAAYVPMEPSFPQARITHILEDSKPALVIYDDTANPAMFTNSSIPAVSFEELAQEASGLAADGSRDVEMLAVPGPDSIAIVLYTSGSTGVPKGVRLIHSAICNRLWWQFRMFPYSDTEVNCVWKTALTFGDSVCEIWGPLLKGRTLVILARDTSRDPQKLVNILAENEIQRLVLVPSLLHSILMYLSLKPSGPQLQHLKLWVCSGENLNKDLAAQFFKYFGDHNGYKLANFYGSTEVMADVTYYVMENAAQLDLHPTVPIGFPLDNCAVYLLNEEMKPVTEAEPGEVWVSGCNLAAGYVAGQGADNFCENPHAAHPDFSRLYRTGDFGILQKGCLLFAGRTDSQVKIRGHRVDLMEVDAAVQSVQGVDECVVLCYGLANRNPEILAFVTIKPDARIAAHHIEANLRNSLTQYMIPQVIEIQSVPLLVNGKVDRQALLKMYENTNSNDDTKIPLKIDYAGIEGGRMEAARVLFETVGGVVGRAARAPISARVGFYELGGNSLNSIYTITKLRDRGYYIEISDFLGAANLGEILKKLSTSPQCGNSDTHEPKYVAEPLADNHKHRVIEMVVSSFYTKAMCNSTRALLKLFPEHRIEIKDYAVLIGDIWLALLDARLSVVLKDVSGTPVAVALNFDARDEPEIESEGTSGLMKIMTILKYIENSVKDTMLPAGKGALLHSFMMATADTLSPQENVAVIMALEQATIQVAKERGFLGVFTTNTNPLTQQLGTDIFGYKTLLEVQINEYVDFNGKKIFDEAPDDMKAIVCWKALE